MTCSSPPFSSFPRFPFLPFVPFISLQSETQKIQKALKKPLTIHTVETNTSKHKTHPQSVFKTSFFLFALQFSKLITLCYVLPRCENQVIHCLAYFPFSLSFHFLLVFSQLHNNTSTTKVLASLNTLVNDPSAGSPTDTLLRLLLPLDIKVQLLSILLPLKMRQQNIQYFHRITQSVGATGGVYKGQGRNQHKLLTCAY